jgi:hypothetical protein
MKEMFACTATCVCIPAYANGVIGLSDLLCSYCRAAIWLYRLTHDSKYLQDAAVYYKHYLDVSSRVLCCSYIVIGCKRTTPVASLSARASSDNLGKAVC